MTRSEHDPAGFLSRLWRITNQSALKMRLLKGMAATVFSQVATVGIQFLTLPVLLHYWGTSRYGLWLVLAAIPTYLSMGDFGFALAAANDMTIAVARGEHAAANRTQQSVLLLIAVLCLAITVIALIAIGVAPTSWFVTNQAPLSEVKQTLFLLILSTLFALAWSVVSATFRAAGRYALGTFLGDLIRLTEAAAIIVGAVFGGSLAIAALCSVVARAFGLIAGLLLARHMVFWLRLGIREAHLDEIKRLLRPALAVSALPVGFAIAIQGMTLVTAQFLGLAAVPILNATRTFSRLIVQAATVVSYPVIPEISRAFGRGENSLLARLIRTNFMLTLVLTLALTVGAFAIGPFLIGLWTSQKIDPPTLFLLAILGTSALQAIWLANSTVLLALNRQPEYSYWFVASACVSVVVAIVCAHGIGLEGIGLGMLVGDAAMVALVLPKVFRLEKKVARAALVVEPG